MEETNLFLQQLEQLQYYLNLSWTIIALVIAVVSITGGILLRQWSERTIEKSLKEHKSRISKLEKDLKENKIINGSNSNGSYQIFPDGRGISYIRDSFRSKKGSGQKESFTVVYPIGYSGEVISTVSARDGDMLPVAVTTIEEKGFCRVVVKPNKFDSVITVTLISTGHTSFK